MYATASTDNCNHPERLDMKHTVLVTGSTTGIGEATAAAFAARGERVKIFNQMTETHRVRDLAELIGRITDAEVQMVPNPRKESAENELHVVNDAFLDLGLEPTKLEEGLLVEVEDVAKKYADRVDRTKIPARSLWTAAQSEGVPAGEK